MQIFCKKKNCIILQEKIKKIEKLWSQITENFLPDNKEYL